MYDHYYSNVTKKAEPIADLVAHFAQKGTEGVDAATFEAVRRGAYGHLVASLDDPSDCAELILSHLVDGVDPLSELDALAAITAEEIANQLKTRFNPTACTLSVVNPL